MGGLAQNRSDLGLSPARLLRSVSSGKSAVAQARFLMRVTGMVALNAQKNAGARRVAPAVRSPILQAYQHRDMRKQAPQLTLDRVKSKLVGKDGLDGQGIRGERALALITDDDRPIRPTTQDDLRKGAAARKRPL